MPNIFSKIASVFLNKNIFASLKWIAQSMTFRTSITVREFIQLSFYFSVFTSVFGKKTLELRSSASEESLVIGFFWQGVSL